MDVIMNELIKNLELFAAYIEWDYPLEWGIECDTLIEHIKEVKENDRKSRGNPFKAVNT